MSRMYAQNTMLMVEVEDKDGYGTGVTVDVYVDYMVDVDTSYGEDADGCRATTLVEYEILDMYLLPSDLMKLNSEEVEWVLKSAKAIFSQRDKHFH